MSAPEMGPLATRAEPAWLAVDDYDAARGWRTDRSAERAQWYCEQLEAGQILFFAALPYELSAADRAFLLEQRPGESRLHKNISYRTAEDRLVGFAGGAAERRRMQEVMRGYSSAVLQFLAQFLAPYAGRWRLDFASFRPLEEAGRQLPLHKRNDLLHTDAFPSRPTRGARILRVFTNLNPANARVWLVAERFPALAARYAVAAGLSEIAAGDTPLGRVLARLGSTLGLPGGGRTAYDGFMLRFHDFLKENADFQANAAKTRVEFPPGATWLVFTDGVPHAVLSGQFALEQTLVVPRDALVAPEHAPVSVLERLAGCPLA